MLESHSTASPTPISAHAFRSYSANSPQAKARLIALALLADGRLDDRELDDLGRRGTFARLGLSREEFFQVLYDFCSDMATTPNREEHYLLSPQVLAGMLAEITEPVEQKMALRLIFDVIRSDGRLALGEARLFWNAVDAWQIGGPGCGRRFRPRRPTPAFARSCRRSKAH